MVTKQDYERWENKGFDDLRIGVLIFIKELTEQSFAVRLGNALGILFRPKKYIDSLEKHYTLEGSKWE